MKPMEQHLLKMLSNNDVTFYIPPYQRNYEWSEIQCETLFNDVLSVTKANIAGIFTEHFFGTIVYVNSQTAFNEPDILILTDGQQRITTTMLLLAAIRDSIENTAESEFIDKKYLKNENITTDTEYKIKLKQVETDWETYKKIILKESIDDTDRKSIVWVNYEYFKRRIINDIDHSKFNVTDLISIGLEKFSIVTIELEPQKNHWENPQEIFESMNSLGKPLSLADLVRNYILLGKTPIEQESLYIKYWLYIEKNLPGKLSDYIRDFMQMEIKDSIKKATEKNYKELYGQFKARFSNENSDNLLSRLKKFSVYYSQIVLSVTTGNKKLDICLQDLKSIEVSTLNSFMLALMNEYTETVITSNDFCGIVNVLINYLLRRKILRLTQGENIAFAKMINEIPNIIKAEDKAIKMFEILSTQENALRFPNDLEVKSALEVMNFYNFAHCKYLLSLVEEKITKSRPDKNDKTLQIEHIMPRTLNNEWEKDLGPNFEAIHNEYVNNIGNLTLIRHNQTLGNKKFDEKKDIYENNAGLQIAREHITDNQSWTKDTIINRRSWIIDYILNNVISLPESMKFKNNFSINQKSRLFSFSFHGLVGKDINFVNDKNIVVKVINDREVLFEGKKMKLSPVVRELMSRAGKLNKSESYQGPIYWEYNDVNICDVYLEENEGEDKD